MSKERMIKQISFSEDNKDVYEIVQAADNASKLVCDAVRFYVEHKDSNANVALRPAVDKEEIRKLIKEELENIDFRNIIKAEINALDKKDLNMDDFKKNDNVKAAIKNFKL